MDLLGYYYNAALLSAVIPLLILHLYRETESERNILGSFFISKLIRKMYVTIAAGKRIFFAAIDK